MGWLKDLAGGRKDLAGYRELPEDQDNREVHAKPCDAPDSGRPFDAILLATVIALVGIGLVSRKGLLYTSGLMQEDDYTVLKQNGAVGAICGRCFDIEGKPCVNSWDDRVIGLTLAELKQIKHKVGIAFGVEKAKAITGALNGRYLDVLITDEAIAGRLLSR